MATYSEVMDAINAFLENTNEIQALPNNKFQGVFVKKLSNSNLEPKKEYKYDDTGKTSHQTYIDLPGKDTLEFFFGDINDSNDEETDICIDIPVYNLKLLNAIDTPVRNVEQRGERNVTVFSRDEDEKENNLENTLSILRLLGRQMWNNQDCGQLYTQAKKKIRHSRKQGEIKCCKDKDKFCDLLSHAYEGDYIIFLKYDLNHYTCIIIPSWLAGDLEEILGNRVNFPIDNPDFLPVKHKNRVKSIFDDLLKPNNKIYVRLDKINYSYSNSNEEAYPIQESAEFSVITEKIYDYDKETILEEGRNLSIKNYRPYFVSLIISLDGRRFNENIDNFSWQEAIIINLEGENDVEQNDVGQNDVFRATLLCSASPFQAQEILLQLLPSKDYILFKGKEINKLWMEDYNERLFIPYISNHYKITSELRKSWRRVAFDSINFYNVGHGNADYIGENSAGILYDIGYQCSKFLKRKGSSSLFPKAEIEFAKLKPRLVIISHWDSDHFIGCSYASGEIFNVKWIAPILDKTISLNAFRLAAFLGKTGKLMLVDRKNAGSFCCNTGNHKPRLVLRMGKSYGDSNITKRNREGLFIDIQCCNKMEVILAGDVPYNCMWGVPVNPNSQLLLHVPHHCSKMKIDPLDNYNLTIPNKHAIISTDIDNKTSGYNEDDKHKEKLEEVFGPNNIHYTIGDLAKKIDDLEAVQWSSKGSIKEIT